MEQAGHTGRRRSKVARDTELEEVQRRMAALETPTYREIIAREGTRGRRDAAKKAERKKNPRYVCDKCGRYFKRGLYMHERFCKGAQPGLDEAPTKSVVGLLVADDQDGTS